MQKIFTVKTLTIGALCTFILAVIMSAIYNSYIHKSQPVMPSASPLPTNYNFLNPTDKVKYFGPPGSNELYNKAAEQYMNDNKVFFQREEQVGQLMHYIPYKGTNFNITYDTNTAVINVVINKEHDVAGNTEFDQFLQQHGIDNRTWIRNLNVVMK